MKILKWIGGIIGGLIVLFLLVGLLLPSTYHVERSIEINRSPELVYWLVADFNQWEQWSPWREIEPDAAYTISKPSFTVGATMAWKGDTVGEGNMTNLALVEGDSIASKLVFIEGEEISSNISWKFEKDGRMTVVTWSMEGPADYIMGRYFGLFMDGMVGSDFEKGLEKLKKAAEMIPEDILLGKLKKSRNLQEGKPAPKLPGIPEETYSEPADTPMEVPVTDKEKELDSLNELLQSQKKMQ